ATVARARAWSHQRLRSTAVILAHAVAIYADQDQRRKVRIVAATTSSGLLRDADERVELRQRDDAHEATRAMRCALFRWHPVRPKKECSRIRPCGSAGASLGRPKSDQSESNRLVTVPTFKRRRRIRSSAPGKQTRRGNVRLRR